MEHNGWEIVEDVVGVLVFVELWIGRLACNSSSIENSFVMCVPFWQLASGSGPKRNHILIA